MFWGIRDPVVTPLDNGAGVVRDHSSTSFNAMRRLLGRLQA
jgi:hypothetical protein